VIITRGGLDLLPDQFAQGTSGRGFVSAAPDQNIKLDPVFIDFPPEPALLSTDRNDNFVHVRCRSRFPAAQPSVSVRHVWPVE
jgi:hypothetical protein